VLSDVRLVNWKTPVSCPITWYIQICNIRAGRPLLSLWLGRFSILVALGRILFFLLRTIVTKLGIANPPCLLFFWYWKATNCVHIPVTVKTLVRCATVRVVGDLAALTAAANDIGHCRVFLRNCNNSVYY
jgi:hypothetical protein